MPETDTPDWWDRPPVAVTCQACDYRETFRTHSAAGRAAREHVAETGHGGPDGVTINEVRDA